MGTVKLYDLLQKYSFNDIRTLFVETYKKDLINDTVLFDNLDAELKEYENIYDWFCTQNRILKNELKGTLSIEKYKAEKEKDYIEIFFKYKNSRKVEINALSEFMMPSMIISEKTVNTYSEQLVLVHFLYCVGYQMIGNEILSKKFDLCFEK